MNRVLGIRWPILVVAVALAAMLAGGATATATAAPLPLRDLDTRAADNGPLPTGARDARARLQQALGDEGIVATDRIGGGARLVARTDRALTAPSANDPATIALNYVRAHPAVFGLAEADLSALRLTSRYRSPGGTTHLSYTQTDRGIAAFDNVLFANVARDGRLMNIGGSAVPGISTGGARPGITASAALAIARPLVGGIMLPTAWHDLGGAEHPTTFANGDRARLTVFSDGRRHRLAWRLELTGAKGYLYEFVVDALNGTVLLHRSLADHAASASVHEYYPGAPQGGTPHTVDLDGDPTWLDRSPGRTILSGNNVHAYADTGGVNGADPDEEIPPSSGTNWLYPRTLFDVPGQNCPLVGGQPGCSWNSNLPATKATNREQATTQLFYFVNQFHDHLKASPIGFTHEARGFEVTDADGAGPGLGGDPVLAEANDSTSLNNALMQTPADGSSPRLQMWFFTNPSLNSSDAGDIVYHEYAHGLTTRSVGTGMPLTANQSRALTEGWADWYALDYLVEQGHIADSAAPGEAMVGAYLAAEGFRRQGADCPVGSSAPACPGTSRAGPGGFTLGDMGRVGAMFEFHDDGEIWLETLWDMRREFGSAVTQALVTEGMRNSPNNPTFIEARDGILIADQADDATRYDRLWQLFAARGMGYSARIADNVATSATEAFDVPPPLRHETTTVDDPSPGGDGDGAAEPGETVVLREALANVNPYAIGAVDGVLTTTTPGVVVVAPLATWPDVAPGAIKTNPDELGVAIPSSLSCGAKVELQLRLATDHGPATVPLRIITGALGPATASTEVPRPIPGTPGVTSTLTFATPGTVKDLKVQIPEVTHTWVGDLQMTLRSPQGTTVTLMNRPGPGALNASGNNLVDLLLDDDAATAIEDIPFVAPTGGYTGSYRPDQPLSAFDGEPRLGTWTLTVVDAFVAEDAGTLDAWGLLPTGRECSSPTNDAPVATADALSITTGATLNAASVLANDNDPDGPTLTALKLTNPAHGTLAFQPDGTFTYTPDAGFSGEDSFTYVAYDSIATSPPVPVRIVVQSPPSAAQPQPPPAPSPPLSSGPSGPPGGQPVRSVAKLEVLRAAVSAGRLDVYARITSRATGHVKLRYRSAGVTKRFTAPISQGTVNIRRKLITAQRRKPTGIFTLTYDGSPTVQPDGVTLRAATRRAQLVRTESLIDRLGRLRVSGTISPRARGFVRVRLTYAEADGSVNFVMYSARIISGTWSLMESLPSGAPRRGGQLSIVYTGYEPARIRGEQIGKDVRP